MERLTAATPPLRAKWRISVRRWQGGPWLPVLGAASILLLWQFLLPAMKVPAYILPTPLQILRKLLSDYSLLLDNLLPTVAESLIGFLLGNFLAVLFAVVFVHSKTVERAYFPILVFFNTIPIVALAPIIIMSFGIGVTSKVIIVAIICFFPTLVNMIRGFESVTRNEMELMRILSANRWEVFWKLRAPRSTPMFFASLRIASTTSVIGAIVGEWIGANKGLGTLIIQATFSYRSDLLYAAITLSSSLALALFFSVVLTEKLFRKYALSARS